MPCRENLIGMILSTEKHNRSENSEFGVENKMTLSVGKSRNKMWCGGSSMIDNGHWENDL